MQALSTNTPVALTDDAVALGAVRRDELALLFTELRGPLLRYLLSLSLTRAEAEDALQETFLRLCEQFASGVCINLRGWVFRVAHNLALDQHRRQARWTDVRYQSSAVEFEPLLPQPRDPRATPEQHAIDQQLNERLEFAMRKLPQHQQYCLHLRTEGLRYREIAEVLGVGTSTIADWVRPRSSAWGRI
jgi:RNA polymerase sigma-70 factor (ECF subfamily)